MDEVAVAVGAGLGLRRHHHLVAGSGAAAQPHPELVSAPLLLLLPSQPRPRTLTTSTTPTFPLPRMRAAPPPPSTAPRPLTQGSVQPASAADEVAAGSELARTKRSSTRCARNWQVRRCGGRLLQRRGPTRSLLLLLFLPRRERVGRPRPLLFKRLGMTLPLLLLLPARSDPSSPLHQNQQAAPPRNPNSRNRNRSTLHGSPRPARSG